MEGETIMTEELKTLKDIETETVECKTGCFDDTKEPIVYSNELRQVAIKHIKHWNKELSEMVEVHGYRPILEGKIEAFIDFFNIIDEDLK